jgi:hypothetical protein
LGCFIFFARGGSAFFVGHRKFSAILYTHESRADISHACELFAVGSVSILIEDAHEWTVAIETYDGTWIAHFYVGRGFTLDGFVWIRYSVCFFHICFTVIRRCPTRRWNQPPLPLRVGASGYWLFRIVGWGWFSFFVRRHDMDNPLSKLKLEYWYHAVIVVCAAGIIVALTVTTKGITNAQALLLFGGGFFVGLGEWVNHPLQSHICQPTTYSYGFTTTSHPRNSRPLGYIFDLLGIGLVAFSIYKILYDHTAA